MKKIEKKNTQDKEIYIALLDEGLGRGPVEARSGALP